MHYHICGDIGKDHVEVDLTLGCGHMFKHGERNKDNDEKHLCPKCNKGPWKLVVPTKSGKIRF